MVKKQRGKTVSSSKPTIVGKQTGNLSLLEPSSDDEAPEEVTFEDSKAQALHSMKQALAAVRSEKEVLKEKRRKRQELFQEQKKRKLLPADVLEEFDATPSKKQNQPEEEAEKTDEEPEKKKDRGNNSRVFGGTYTVMTVKGSGSACSQQQAAEDFLRSRLYGPGSRRTTCNELLSIQNKRGREKSAAVEFVKKGWASQQKAKSEKLKKRWLQRRQQNPS
ncbi:nucleolar protein 7 [Takifugu rubripes]|uniref:U3 small nucleolar RNA-associated protein NOL7 C-terminal domain-containing protein n=1 Tax=Takifugu bimaculatus TaxID=433685 RepID=A0A4Z2C1H9_9TELE|nr:nucleolar protein 7 [Takifugu rubripes]XP_056912680.1 nucleolar protein 7 [Takifugu flavidus]TNM97671.1 hypothetical protein fugu_013917 [Takifugu bimaculatus]TNM97676.1 hypothetical protein fugu_013922 [Takifugu bimaculatus]|eukprot:XP_011615386.1 PREDICTED: nucleolar protein 7 [Takifugu rubripes]